MVDQDDKILQAVNEVFGFIKPATPPPKEPSDHDSKDDLD